MRRKLFLLGAIVGTILPYYYLISFLTEQGVDLAQVRDHLFRDPLSAFAWMDVVVSSLVLWIFVFAEGRRLGMKNLWVYIVCNLAVGVSLALPLFLFAREGRLDRP